MAILSKGTTYADGDQITSTNLNALVDSATFASGAVESGGGIQLNGSGQLKVAGNVDIGTSNLTATGTVSLGTTSFAGDVTFDTTTLKVDASNNRVGIGTASPSYLLDVSPTSDGGEIARFKSDTTNAAADVLIVDQDNSNTRAALQVQGNAGSTECLFVGSNGNVGINTVDPDFLLDINDDAATGAGIRVTGGGGGGPLAQFVRDVSSSGSIAINIAGGDPQFQLTSSGSDVMTIGLDGSENTFQVCAGSSVGSNQVLVVGTNGKVGIGETVPSAPLTVTSTTGGVLLPRMTTTQMNAISSPANGEMIYNTTANKFYGYAGGAWVALH